MQSKKDSQNQYRTGVLVANHVEDRFGSDLIGKGSDWQFPKSEMKSRFDLTNTMYSHGRENYPTKPVTEDEIVADAGYKEYAKVFKDKRGQPGHILMGHGATQDAFEKRDFATTNELFFDKKMKTETLINPHFYDNTKCKKDYFVTNAKLEDTATLFKPKPKSEIKSKSYAESTKKFDHTFTKVGFRE